jgi:hypothetical protein
MQVVPRTGPDAVNPTIGSNRRPPGGARSRFAGTSHHANRAEAALGALHPAVVEGRTLFPSTVVGALDAPRVLVSGRNNAKIGAVVEKGPWAGMPIFTLTLEERATCPRTCELWRECFGNAIHMARRHRHGPDLIVALDRELRMHAASNPRGFVVRLHVLGDFYATEYVGAWAQWMLELPALRVFGYTARLPNTEIGELIAAMNGCWPDRWAIRFSVAGGSPHLPQQVTTIWRQPDGPRQPEGLMCPQSLERTAACATCGLCWAPDLAPMRIVFVGHGMRRRAA